MPLLNGILMLSLLWMTAHCLRTPDQTLKERFLKEAPSQWQEYCRYTETLNGTATQRIEINGKVDSLTEYEFKSNLKCRLWLVQSLLREHPVGECIVFNPSYSFRLRRKSADQPWRPIGIDRNRGQVSPLVDNDLRSSKEMLSVLTYVYQSSLPELIQQTEFRIVEAKEAIQDGMQLVQIDFDNSHPVTVDDGRPFYAIQGGSLVLDPNRFWCLRAGDLHIKHLGTVETAHIESVIQDSPAGYPIPMRWVESGEAIVLDESGNEVSRVQATITKDYHLSLSSPRLRDEEFTISAFGMQEPFGANWPEPPNSWLWVVVAATVAGLLGVLCFVIKRRRSQAVTA